jgi:hypothetical protein
LKGVSDAKTTALARQFRTVELVLNINAALLRSNTPSLCSDWRAYYGVI